MVPGLAPRMEFGAGESHHLLHVIRLARGEIVAVTDGDGGRGEAELVEVIDGRAVLALRAELAIETVPERTVLLGVPRAALLEEALTLGTECGATSFLLVRARHSPPGEPRVERLARVLRAAVTQCGRATVPALAIASLSEAITRTGDGSRWIATPRAHPPSPSPVATVAIGPEGGWAGAEQDALHAAGFVPCGLGPHVQRTPTAVAAALARLSL